MMSKSQRSDTGQRTRISEAALRPACHEHVIHPPALCAQVGRNSRQVSRISVVFEILPHS